MEEEIKKVAENLGIGYLYDDWSRINIRADKEITYPLCINLLPVSGVFKFQAGLVYDSPNCLFAFLDKTNLDFDGATNAFVVNDMKKIALKFITAINKSGKFEVISGSVPYSVVYDKLDVNLTGVVIECKLTPTTGICEDAL